MPVNVSVRGIEKLQALFKRVPVEIRKGAVEEATKYFIGDSVHGLKHMVNYKYVSRKAAYGQTFLSDKQRRYVMARIHEGTINPGSGYRSGEMARGWSYKKQGGGYGATIYNPVKGAEFVYGDASQANQIRMVGHRTISAVIKSNLAGAIMKVNEFVARWIKLNNR